MKKSIHILIQARSGSTRLPNKVMMDLSGKSIIEHIYERCMATGYKTSVLTSDSIQDNDFSEFLFTRKIPYFRGSLDNVLERYIDYSEKNSIENIVRVTGDNPFIDFRKIMLFGNLPENTEYSAITGGALGTGSEFVTLSALKRQLSFDIIPEYFEHVTLCIRKNPESFIIENIPGDHSLTGMRLTVDEIDDYNMIKKIYNILYKGRPIENHEIAELMKKNPGIFRENAYVRQNRI